jgi:hypothetical protein
MTVDSQTLGGGSSRARNLSSWLANRIRATLWETPASRSTAQR